ncbi:hypothetical protein FRB91_006972 [Serendipita sp. 411]|nr:hypothetical protein FRC18_007586 [Serendipita sp. 400]KAG8852148.1 hypothetical protein FRB91_006972 [Serendipita sp. 411]
MEDPAASVVVDATMPIGVPVPNQEIKAKKRRATESQVTAFQAATPFPDLLDPRALLEPQSGSSSSDPNSGSSDPSTGDDSSPSPSSFLGTPYSTSLQFDYPFPISNAPRDPVLQAPSALPIASSLASAPSLITAAASSVTPETSESAASNPLPSMVSTIAASMDTPINNTLTELRHYSNKSTSSLGSTHSGHTQTSMVPSAPIHSSTASLHSTHSISPSSSFQAGSHFSQPPPRPKGRHSLIISPLPPPPLSLQNHATKASGSPTAARRPKLQPVSSVGSNGSDTSHESLPVSHGRSRPPSGSLSSLSIASLQLLSNPGEPPIPPSLLNKLNRPRNTSTNSNATSYFSSNAVVHKGPNSRDFFGSPTYDTSAASLPSSPPTNLNTDSSSSDFYKPTTAPPNRTGFSVFRPHLGRSNSTSTSNSSFANRPFFGRSSTSNSHLQSRAYAQHLRHQQEQQLRQEEQKRKEDQKKKVEKEKEKKKPSKIRRSSLSLSRSPSGSSASSARTKASSSTKSKSPSSSNSQTDGFKLSPTQSSLVESAVDESEGSASPEGTKIRRRSSVRRILEKTGSLVGFNLSLNARIAGTTSPKEGKRSPKRSGNNSPKERGNVSPKRSGKESPNVRNTN